MTALLIILNVTFTVIVLAAMLSLHGWAILRDRERTGLRLRPRFRFSSVRWARQAVPAAR